MVQFGISAAFNEPQAMMFGQVPSPTSYSRGIQIVPNPFQCCGISTIRGFGNESFPANTAGWQRKAAWLAGLWNINRGRTHFVYVLNYEQTQQSVEHKALLEVGSSQVCQFPNLQPYHNNQLYMFVVNLNEGIGKFFDAAGVPFKEKPKAEEVAAPKKKTVVVKEALKAPVKESNV